MKNIISARDNKCPFCGGKVYTIKTKDKRIIEQCSTCGALRILKEGKK